MALFAIGRRFKTAKWPWICKEFGLVHDDLYNQRGFVCYFYAIGWHHISLGLHLDWQRPNLEIHLPFGFIRVGW